MLKHDGLLNPHQQFEKELASLFVQSVALNDA